MTPYLVQAFIYLCAAVITVPIANRLGLGSVLGYLIAGVIIGPVTGLVGQETNTIQHFAEFGVVMMLFLVGLELEAKTLWGMRHRLIGLGGLQVALTTMAIMLIAMQLGQSWSTALTIGLIFSLSSTAIVLQTFNEKKLTKTDGGKASFSVLLFQDIAVIPMLALIPLLALPELIEASKTLSHSVAEHHEELSLVADLSGWAHTIVVIAAIAVVAVGGHYLSRPLFRYIASTGLREIFTVSALMLVIGIAALMSLVGLSPALGAFLAGVVLATSEFRHELESDIEPFKGLLLGLFFITVGAGINFTTLSDHFSTVALLTFGIVFLKAAILFVLSLIFKIRYTDRWLFTLSLAQAGEFGFVLLSYSSQHHVLPYELIQLLSLVVAISMFLTPGLFILFDKVIVPRFQQSNNQQPADKITEQGPVIIAGIGRFGQIVNRLLVANNIKTVVLDHQAAQIDMMRKVNIKGYFGDASRPGLLHAAGISHTKLLIIAIDDREGAIEIVQHVKRYHAGIKILVRAFDRGHYYELYHAGADFIVSETYYSALELGSQALVHLGFHPFRAERLKSVFMEAETYHNDKLYHSWKHIDEAHQFTDHYRDLFLQLEELISETMKEERSDKHTRSERGWTPPPKNYIDEIKK